MLEKKIPFDAIAPFYLNIQYCESDPRLAESRYEQHAHAECEIVVHLAGDIAFMVENHLYPMLPGSVIIARPYEYHHCIYQSNAVHRHFWILFSAEGNERLFDLFFNRAPGENNLLVLTPDNTARLVALCRAMLEQTDSPLENYGRFFSLIRLLRTAGSRIPPAEPKSPDLAFALAEIDGNLTGAVSVRSLAEGAHVSVSTLERHFLAELGMSPTAYLRRKRLARAAELLAGGANVTDACIQSGFSDCSGFIAQFKKAYGVTPLAFRRNRNAWGKREGYLPKTN